MPTTPKRPRPRKGAVMVELTSEDRDRLDKLCGIRSREIGMKVSAAQMVRFLVREEFDRKTS